MKKHSMAIGFALIGLGIIGSFTCCSLSNEKKAKDIIDHQLQVSLHDYDSYELVEFGTLDSTFSSAFDLPEYNDAINKAENFKKQGISKIEDAKLYAQFESMYEKQIKYAQDGKALLDSAMYYLKIAEKIDSTFVPEFVGWEMTHTFRANNANGNKVIAHRKYYFDKEMTRIVDEENLDE